MKQFFSVMLVMLVLVATGVFAAQGVEQPDYTEVSPTLSAAPSGSLEATWDLLFSFDVQAATGGLGNAGAEFDGTYFYTTRWASNLIHRYDTNGTMMEEFSISGVSGLRDLAYDGTYMYGGAAANTIYMMDFITKTLIGQINSPVAVRNIAYDEANDAFWVGNWNTDLMLVDRNGNTLAVIPATTHNLGGMYGSAYDKWTPGGPFLWVFDQGQGGGNPQLIHQIDLNTLTLTGVTYDVANDFPGANNIAGGLWSSDEYQLGLAVLGGLMQGQPDMFFVYELAPAGDADDPLPPTNFSAYSDYTMADQMLLTWSDPTSYVNGNPLTNFSIVIARDGSVIDTVASGVQTYTDTGLTDGTEYTYTIWAVDSVDSASSTVEASWIAGGAHQPNPPTNFALVDLGGGTYRAYWTNPSTNVDGTPMDDFDAINLYEDGTLLTSFTRSPADTGAVDSADFTPSGGTHAYYVTAVDNETPPYESDPSNLAYSPLGIPFFDDFPNTPVPDSSFWINENAEVTDVGINPPSPPYELTLDGHPTGGDFVTLLPVDLSSYQGQGMILSFWYQPEGSGNAPETGDSLAVDFKDDQGNWHTVWAIPGTSVQPFENVILSLDALNPTGATYFHNNFQFRFRNHGTQSSSSHFDHWLIDNVYLGLPNNPPIMVTSPTELTDTLLVGGTDVMQFTVSNTQSQPSVLNVTVTEDPAVDWLSVSPDSATITSSQTQTFDVTFDASVVTAGVYTTQLIVAGNDSSNLEDTVFVTLVANENPIIYVHPDSFYFDLLSNQTDSATFYIRNDGNGPLEIIGIEDEEVSSRNWKPLYQQQVHHTPVYSKGAFEPTFGEQTKGSGGPDPFGYKWIDSDEPNGPTYQFIDISTTGTPVTLQPTGGFDPYDEGQAQITLPFNVKFYGQSYNQVQVNTNGFITFDMNFWANAFSNAAIPDPSDPNGIVAVFWDDLDGRAGGEIYTQQIGNQFIIQWDNWGHYPQGTQGMKFQVVLFQESATILLVYEHIDDQGSSTYGIESMDGTTGLQIAYNQNYAHDQLLVKISKGVEWLSENPTSGTIAPGDSMAVTLNVNTASMFGGLYQANVVIQSNDPVNPVFKYPKVTLHVTGTPDISTTPDSLNFGTSFLGVTPQMVLNVDNAGTDTLYVTNVYSTEPVFTVDTTNFTLEPLSGLPVTVTFNPLVVGTYSGWIVIESNDPDTPFDSTYVSAEAIEGPLAIYNPNYSNPVQVNENDSVDVSINVANAGGSDLVFTVSTSPTPMSRLALQPPVYGPAAPSEFSEVTPKPQATSGTMFLEATWDLLFSFDLQVATGALGNAGAEFDGTYFYTTRWASNLLHRYDLNGNLVEEFSIPGVSGLRDLAYDGTYMYGGAAANTIYMMDFITKTLIGQINSPVAVRNIAYDEANDAFWVGNWNTDLVLVDRNGNALATIPATTHGLGGMYGSAYDPWTDNGPYLWVFDQGAGGGNPQLIHQIDLNTLMPTGVTYDVANDFPGANNIAGGLWSSPDYIPGKAVIGGVMQGQPDMFFVYELAETTPPWLKLLTTGGTVAPGNNMDVNLRVYGVPTRLDTMYVVFNSNDPQTPVANIPIIRELLTGIGGANAIPTTYDVAQNYPNPFNPTTTIKYQLPEASQVKLVVYNVLGQKVRTLVNKQMQPGYYQVVWDGRNDQGVQVSSGIYIYRFESDGLTRTMKMILMK